MTWLDAISLVLNYMNVFLECHAASVTKTASMFSRVQYTTVVRHSRTCPAKFDELPACNIRWPAWDVELYERNNRAHLMPQGYTSTYLSLSLTIAHSLCSLCILQIHKFTQERSFSIIPYETTSWKDGAFFLFFILMQKTILHDIEAFWQRKSVLKKFN